MSKRKGDPGYRGGWCIHYRYNRDAKTPEQNTCEAGVRYDSFAPKEGGPRYTVQPCFLDKGQSKPDALPCEHLRRPTPEEMAASDKWSADRMSVLGTVMTGIKPWRDKWKGKSHGEVVECPACKGRLSLSIAAYNGHVHGACATEGCASWME